VHWTIEELNEPEMKVHEIAKDGLPDMDQLTGRVAFIFNGCIITGWPLHQLGYPVDVWEADDDVGRSVRFTGVEKCCI